MPTASLKRWGNRSLSLTALKIQDCVCSKWVVSPEIL